MGVESEEGHGSVFWFVLPLEECDEESALARRASGTALSVDEHHGEIQVVEPGVNRVLLVEDNPVNQKVAIRILEKLGFAVTAAGNGLEALRSLELAPYDLVLTDVQMPEMDGLELARAIRSLPGDLARIPIVAMTANAMKGDREKCLAAGMDDYVAKPVETAELSAAVHRWIGRERRETA